MEGLLDNQEILGTTLDAVSDANDHTEENQNWWNYYLKISDVKDSRQSAHCQSDQKLDLHPGGFEVARIF